MYIFTITVTNTHHSFSHPVEQRDLVVNKLKSSLDTGVRRYDMNTQTIAKVCGIFCYRNTEELHIWQDEGSSFDYLFLDVAADFSHGQTGNMTIGTGTKTISLLV